MFTVLILHMLHGGVFHFGFTLGAGSWENTWLWQNECMWGGVILVIIHPSFPDHSFQRISIALEGVQAVRLALLAAFSN